MEKWTGVHPQKRTTVQGLRPAGNLPGDLWLFAVLGVSGVAASHFNVSIPHTDMYFEVRWAFGYLGFALLRRFWATILLAGLLSGGGPHEIPLTLAFSGNMLYAVPCLALVRFSHQHLLSRCRNVWWFAAGWFLLVLVCYQLFNTPVLWGLLALLRDVPVLPMILSGWRDQPWLVESLIVGIICASGMTAIRSHLALLQGRHELAITLDAIGDGVIATDARGRIVRMNPVARSLTGWPLPEALGQPVESVFRIVNTRTGEPAENPVSRVLREGTLVGLANHTCLIAKEGAEYQIADSAAPIFEADGRLVGTVMVFRDVTREYRDRQALRESEHRFRSFVENANDLVYALSPEGIFTYVSPNWSEAFGEPPESAVGRSFEPYVHPEDIHLCRGFLAEVLQSGERQSSVEYRVRQPDGTWHWHTSKGSPLRNDAGEVIGYVGIARDVNRRKQMEEALHRRTEELELAQRIARIGNWSFDPHTETITWSQEMYPIFGRDPEAGPLSIRDHYAVLHPEDYKLCADALSGALEKGEDYELTYCIRVPDQGIKHLQTLGKVVQDPDGRVLQVFGTTQDITEQVQIREEKAELEAQFHQAQKLESVGRLAGGVAHDLNNLLAPILGYSEMLLEDFSEDDARRASVEEIARACMRARDLVRQLLAFSRKQPLEFKPIDLNSVLKRFEKLLRRTLREDIAVIIDPAPDLPLIEADVGQLEQVIMNLAVNAQDAMEEGGALTIETVSAELDADYAAAHQGVAPGDFVLLSISDTGRGMDAETRERLFEPFFTTKAKDKGTGLGLATVYGIVKQHGGNIWVYSEIGEGTVIKVYLPVSEAAGTAEEVIPESAADQSGSETILLVEDDDGVRALSRSILERYGYTVRVADSGQSAMDIVDGCSHPIHLLLTDVVMPDMNGKELFKRIGPRCSNLRVLFMSGYTDNVIANRGVLDSGVHFIQKPFTVKDLATKVREVLDEKPPSASSDSNGSCREDSR